MGVGRVERPAALKDPVGEGFQSVNLAFRKNLKLFANFRPVRSIPGRMTRYSDVLTDQVIFREIRRVFTLDWNTEWRLASSRASRESLEELLALIVLTKSRNANASI